MVLRNQEVIQQGKNRRVENSGGTEQNLGVQAEFRSENKRFLRVLPAGRISLFMSRIYPSLLLNQRKKALHFIKRSANAHSTIKEWIFLLDMCAIKGW